MGVPNGAPFLFPKQLGNDLSDLTAYPRGIIVRQMAKHDSHLDALFLALGDATRRDILTRLSRGPATVSELAAPHKMALPSFMGHVQKLEAAGMIETRKTGRQRHCVLAPTAFAPVTSWLDAQTQLWQRRLDQFDNYVLNLNQEREDDP